MNPLIDERLSAYAAEHRRSGDADPMPYLRDLEGTDRAELIALIDAFLAAAPPPPFDPERFAALRADPATEAAVERIVHDPLTLLEARQAARMGQQQLATRLARDLGLVGRETAVKAAYHEIETGQVTPEVVRAPVWGALAAAFGVAVDRLKEAAAGSAPTPGASGGVVFARAALPPPAQFAAPAAPAAPLPPPASDAPGDDVVVRAAFFE